MSIHFSDKYKAAVIESLRRAKFKFPGRQKVFCSWKKLRMQITYIAFFEIDLRLQ
jgi:ribosomal protein L16/L10AE